MSRIKVSQFVHDHLVGRNKKSFTLSTFSTGGPGGQKQNSSQAGIRITDKETGISAEGREFRSQPQNKAAAFERLVERLVEHYKELEERGKLERFKANLAECRVYKDNLKLAKDSETGYANDLQDTLDGDLNGFIRERLIKECNE